MNKLPLVLVSAAVLTACGTASSSGSARLHETSTGAVVGVVSGGSNAANGVGATDNADLGRVNLTIRKGSNGLVAPSAPTQLQSGAANSSPSNVMRLDRCSQGVPSGSGLSPRSGTASGKHLPLPMCAPQ